MKQDKKNIYIIGNPIVNRDNLPYLLLPKLTKDFPDISFVLFDPTEELPIQKSYIFIDAVEGIDTVTIFEDLTAFSQIKGVSVHDFDLLTDLLLLIKLGKIKKISIVGIPMKKNPYEIYSQVTKAVSTLL